MSTMYYNSTHGLRMPYIQDWVSQYFSTSSSAQSAGTSPVLYVRDTTTIVRKTEGWEERPKEIRVYFPTVIRSSSSDLDPLNELCVNWVLNKISDPACVSIDDDTRLTKLTIGNKTTQTELISGKHNIFRFSYFVDDKRNLKKQHGIVIGCIIADHAFVVDVVCTAMEETLAYLREVLLPALVVTDSVVLSRTPDPLSGTAISNAHQKIVSHIQNYGELLYTNTQGGIRFSIPMYPMRMDFEYSPTQSGGMGNLVNCCLMCKIYRPQSDVASGQEQVLEAKDVILHVEVQDILRTGFPHILSIQQYNSLKIEKLLADNPASSKLAGNQLQTQVAGRPGMAVPVTFPLDMEGGNQKKHEVKGMLTSTLASEKGITVVYITRVEQGLFNFYLPVLHHLLRTLKVIPERELAGAFRTSKATNVTLKDTDIAKLYSEAGEKAEHLTRRHIAFLRMSAVDAVGSESGIEIEVTAAPPGVKEEVPRSATPEETHSAPVDYSSYPIRVGQIEHLNIVNPWDHIDVPVETPLQPLEEGHTQSSLAAAPLLPSSTPSFTSEPEVESNVEQRLRAPIMIDPVLPLASPLDKSPIQDNNSTTMAVTLQETSLQKNNPISPRKSTAAPQPPFVFASSSSLRAIYMDLCSDAKAKPNSSLLSRLQDNPRIGGFDELDLSVNYLGNIGFSVVAKLLSFMPRVHTAHFNDMCLDNTDAKNLVESLVHHPGIRRLYLKSNPKLGLPASKEFKRLARQNTNIQVICLDGSSIGYEVIKGIQTILEGRGDT